MTAQTSPEMVPDPWPQVPVLEPHHFETEPMESEHHLVAMLFLYELVVDLMKDRSAFVGADLVVYFSELQVRNKDFRAPDLIVVTDVPERARKGWIVWQEDGRYPELVVEMMSPTTRHLDLGRKLYIYSEIWKVSEYYAFDLETGELHAFAFKAGERHLVKRTPDASGRYFSEILGAHVGVGEGGFGNHQLPVVRLFDASGVPVPTSAERARAESERAQAESQRADRLETELRELKAKLGLA
jgi:Uma2 family endonuclease